MKKIKFLNNRVLRQFDLFLCSDVNLSKYNFISYSCLEYCSYVKYIVFDYSRSKPLLLDFDDIKDLKKYSDFYYMYAINYLDNYILEVLYDI